MATFVIETPHNDEECRIGAEQWLKLDGPRKQELFDKSYASCEFGEHNAWLIAEFRDEDEAWSYIPEVERAKAKVQQVASYSFDEMVAAHAS